MSTIKKLTKDPNYTLNIIDLFKMFSPDGKTKYVDMFLRLMNNTPDYKNHVKEVKANLLDKFPFLTKEQLDEFGDFEIVFYSKFIESMFTWDDFKNFRKFCEYNERGLIEQNDVSRYKTFDEIISQLQVAEIKVSEKEMEKQIIKLFEDSEWLILRPLSFEASKKYGANTKWCTTQENNPDYFFKYAKKGVLVYCINKKNGYKVASFNSLDKNDPEFSWWNQKDSRIDSLQAEITTQIRELIGQVSMDKKAKTNHSLLDDKEKSKQDKDLGYETKSSRRAIAVMDSDEDSDRTTQEVSVSEDNNHMEETRELFVNFSPETPDTLTTSAIQRITNNYQDSLRRE
jgi:hypothetical protein